MPPLSENFLRKLHNDRFIHYVEGTDTVYTAADFIEPAATTIPTAVKELYAASPLKEMDERMRGRFEKVIDLVLFRYGSTGCQQVINRAVKLANVVAVYPVRSVRNFGPLKEGSVAVANGPVTDDQHSSVPAFVDCYLMAADSTIRELSLHLFSESGLERAQLVVEAPDGRQLSEDDLVKDHPVAAFKLRGADDR